MMDLSRHSRLRAAITVVISFAFIGATFMPAPAQGQSSPSFTNRQLVQLAAPIALYPDALLTQVLMAATYPLDVVQAARWRRANPGLRGNGLEQALQRHAWDESVKALTAFPDILRMMDERLEWTERLGEAFIAQEDDLLAAVQELRRRAAEAGNLNTTPQQRVSRSGAYWIIEPVDPELIYVPAYESAVYGMWPYPDYPAYGWYVSRRVPGRIIWFAAVAVIGTALWARWDWNRRQVAIDPARFNRFNRTARTTTSWQHDPLRRRGAPYRVPALVNKFKAIQPPRIPRDIRARQLPPAVVVPGVKRVPGARTIEPRLPPSAIPPRAVAPRVQTPNVIRRAPPPAISRPRPEVRRAPPVSRPAISRPPPVSRPAPAAPRAAPPPRAPARAAAPRAAKPAPKTK